MQRADSKTVTLKPVACGRRVKLRTTISISKSIHAVGLKLAAIERRDFSAMLENAIEEKWNARRANGKKLAVV